MRFAATVALLSTCIASSHADTGKVVYVASGDALIVLSAGPPQLVRIAGILAPENGHAYAERSRQSLEQMADGKAATLECRDRREHKVCKVKVQPLGCPNCGHTLDVGLAQLVAGAAKWDREHASEQSEEDRGRYESEETEARLRRRGLWGLPLK